MSIQSASISIPAKPGIGSLLKAGVIGGTIAAGLNVILLLLAGMFGIALDLMAGPPPAQQTMALTTPAVVVFTILPAIIGALLLFVLARFTTKSAAIFIVIAVVVTLLSLLPVLSQPLTAAGMIVLALMHVIAAGVITYWLIRRA